MDYEKMYEKALQKIAELEAENKMKDKKIAELKEQIVDLHAQKSMIEAEFEQNDVMFSEIYHENQFNKQRVNELEQSFNTVNNELKRVKTKYEITSLEQFMEHYGLIMERADIKIIQEKFFEETGIKYSVQQLKRELEQIGYQVKRSGHGGVEYYVSKNTKGHLYIVQLAKHKDTSIYKVGRTADMKNRLRTYKQHDGGANEIKSSPVNNQFKAEAKLLQLLNDAVDRNELKKDEYGDEYFEGSLDVIKKYYDAVVQEFKDEE